jgi:hypothetical protein
LSAMAPRISTTATGDKISASLNMSVDEAQQLIASLSARKGATMGASSATSGSAAAGRFRRPMGGRFGASATTGAGARAGAKVGANQNAPATGTAPAVGATTGAGGEARKRTDEPGQQPGF